MRWCALLASVWLLACQTDEVRAWKRRRAQLEVRQAELMQLETAGRLRQAKGSVEAFRRAIDVPAFLRERSLDARVFVEPGVTRVTFRGTVQACRDTVESLREIRWLTPTWRLRLEEGQCDWEARTDADSLALEQALLAPPPRWTPPVPETLSGGVSELKAAVTALELDLRAREARLGDLAVLQGKLDAVQPLIDSMRARAEPCDLAVIDRELALDAPAQGALLEVESHRLVHPLEPRNDFRLRGLATFRDGVATWHCEPL